MGRGLMQFGVFSVTKAPSGGGAAAAAAPGPAEDEWQFPMV